MFTYQSQSKHPYQASTLSKPSTSYANDNCFRARYARRGVEGTLGAGWFPGCEMYFAFSESSHARVVRSAIRASNSSFRDRQSGRFEHLPLASRTLPPSPPLIRKFAAPSPPPDRPLPPLPSPPPTCPLPPIPSAPPTRPRPTPPQTPPPSSPTSPGSVPSQPLQLNVPTPSSIATTTTTTSKYPSLSPPPLPSNPYGHIEDMHTNILAHRTGLECVIDQGGLVVRLQCLRSHRL